MVKTKEERGTHRAHRFASLSILMPRFRLIASLRFHPRNGGTLLAVEREKWERGQRSYTTAHTLKGPRPGDPPFEATIHVVVRYQMGQKWGKHGCQYLIYAVLGEVGLCEVADRYRGRFGIESSYRIMGQALARTSSRSPALRLLQVAVAMQLQNQWVILKLQWASEGRQGPSGFVVHDELLRFAVLLELLGSAIVRRLGAVREVHRPRVERPQRPPPTSFGSLSSEFGRRYGEGCWCHRTNPSSISMM